MAASFVKGIEDPDRLQPQQQQESAREVVRERLRAYDMVDVPDYALRKLTYTYYHDWKTDDPRFMFLLEDPGIPGEHAIMEVADYVDLDPGYDPYDAVQIDRRFGARWLAKRGYTDFTGEFLQACKDNGLIELEEPWWQYLLSGGFFDDFYMAENIMEISEKAGYQKVLVGCGGAHCSGILSELEVNGWETEIHTTESPVGKVLLWKDRVVNALLHPKRSLGAMYSRIRAGE